jgi:hypothetical protein
MSSTASAAVDAAGGEVNQPKGAPFSGLAIPEHQPRPHHAEGLFNPNPFQKISD